VIWRFDMRDEVGVFPHNIASSAVLILSDRLFVTTSNGQDWSHINIPAPKAPSLICLDKATGALLGEEASGISERLFHANWSSPAYAEVDGRKMVVFGAGDGFVYGFDPNPVDGPDDFKILKELWRFDAIPASYRTKDGKPIKYTLPEGPSEVISTPVIYKNRAYVAIGQDPEHGDGVGYMSCIDLTKSGDITQTGKVWGYNKITRSISTASIFNDLVFMADYAGNIHCVDANTGQPYWVHNSGSHIWGSTMVADNKLFIGNENGDFFIMAPTKEKKILFQTEFPGPVYSTAIAANGALYVATPTHLYALAKK
jgi:outer membrane protein assembly factor BamB